MKKFGMICSLLVVLWLAGCATVPMATPELDTKAKAFTPAPGKGSLYVYRNENFGSAIPMTVSLNGRNIGQTASKTYFFLTLDPGKYSVESHAENVASVGVDVESGQNYFVWQEVKMGLFMARSALQVVDDKTGRAGVLESKMVAANTLAAIVPGDTATQKLDELEALRKSGKISEAEYQKKRSEILQRM